jgi:hypothetical protein
VHEFQEPPSVDDDGQEMQLLQGGCEIPNLSALESPMVCEEVIQVLFLGFLRLYHESQGYSHG